MLFADLRGVFRRHEKTCKQSRGVEDLKTEKLSLAAKTVIAHRRGRLSKIPLPSTTRIYEGL